MLRLLAVAFALFLTTPLWGLALAFIVGSVFYIGNKSQWDRPWINEKVRTRDSDGGVPDDTLESVVCKGWKGLPLRVLRNRAWKQNRPTMLFVHGFPDAGSLWVRNMTFFLENDFNVVAVTLRGYEDISVPADHDFSMLACGRDIVAIVAGNPKMFQNGVHVVGHDWGSGVVQMAAKLDPAKFDTVTLVAVPHLRRFAEAIPSCLIQLFSNGYMLLFSIPIVTPWLLRGGYTKLFRLKEIRRRGLLAYWLNTSFSEGYSADYLEGCCARMDDPRLAVCMLAYYRQNVVPSLLPKLAETRFGRFLVGDSVATQLEIGKQPLDVPTLQIAGELDMFLRFELTKLLAGEKDFPKGVRTVKFDKVGHWPNLEAPELFNQVIHTFVTTSVKGLDAGYSGLYL